MTFGIPGLPQAKALAKTENAQTSSRGVSPLRHREERSDDAIHLPGSRPPQLLRLGIPGLPRADALAKTEK